jgi:hypothetical protein
MNQERSVIEQAKSGMRLAATLLAAILVLSLLVAGLHSFSLAQRLGLGVIEILIALGLLFATVGRWAKWFFAACCGNFLRLLVALVYSLLSLTPVRWALLAVCFLVASWAYDHFLRSRGRQPSFTSGA